MILELYGRRKEKKRSLALNFPYSKKPASSKTNKNFGEIVRLENKIIYVTLFFCKKLIFIPFKG
jgi:hypothetical protein